MNTFKLSIANGHMFLTAGSCDWLFDTGDPISFGDVPTLAIRNKEFQIADSYMGLTARKLSEYIGRKVSGIIGADILNMFDMLINVPDQNLTFSSEQMEISGDCIELDSFMGIPIVSATIDGKVRRMFFDTGAQISYFQDESIAKFPSAGQVTDFYPGVGQFNTDTHLVETIIGGSVYKIRCGSLPGLLGMTLMMASTEGIVGNEILRNKVVGYFPRRRRLVLP